MADTIYSIEAPREAILAWKYDDVTRLVRELLQKERLDYMKRMGEGETLGDRTAEDTARCVGRIEGLQFVEDVLNAHFLSEEESDDTTEIAEDIRPARPHKTQRGRKAEG